ncbi:MAG: RluA family pseudouridine synthase [Deltaproteobacteria bacterium]|jgi:23S rRNA pseudouridine1911/1915/1917 synthase|nr:RluA family pseudouridine synthase [Deltaproteobacteria bacterium]
MRKPLRSLNIGPNEAGQRLDAALSGLFPDLGLRARRRLWQAHDVRVDGKAARPGLILLAGQRVDVLPRDAEQPAPLLPAELGLRLLTADSGYCAFFKPAGLPSAHLAGGDSHNAEACIKAHWPELASAAGLNVPGNTPLLCNRLDAATSGLLLGAFSEEARRRFRELEKSGLTDKYYYVLAHGRIPGPLYLEQAMLGSGRSSVLLLPEKESDPARHTRVLPLRVFTPGPEPEGSGGQVTLARAHILRGSRHQIRAHLAGAGFPIVGDKLYGNAAKDTLKPDQGLYLHHYRIRFGDFAAEAPPPDELWGKPPVSFTP